MASALIATNGKRLTKAACELCGDSGIVPVPDRPVCVPVADLWKWQAPCGCRAGEQWREEARLVLNPPPCETGCGRVARVTLLTFPRCLPCDRLRRVA